MKSSCLTMPIMAISSARLTMVALAMWIGSLGASAAVAQQSSALKAVYGRGVHAYFAGNSTRAEQLFTQVIQAGSTDPRPYYFRAMVRLGMGRQFEAENDMRIGAAYEARNPGVQGSIGRSLQRLQGQGRRTLEEFRRQARLDRLQQGRQQTQQRYEQLDRRGPAVLRRAAPLPLEQQIQPPQTTAPGPAEVPQPEMPAPALTTPEPLPADTGAAPAGSDTRSQPEDDLFETPAPVTPADDPFGGTPTPEPTPTPAPEPTPEPEADPFGELPSPAEEDPFGESTTPEPVPTEQPQPEMTDDDPFGTDPAVEPAPPAEADDQDPFDESTTPEALPTEEPQPEMADDDPFGTDPADEPAPPADADDQDPFGEATSDEPMESTESTEAEDDPFGESMDSPDDDPFGESSESATEDDPFGEDSTPADDSPADENDPFGESMEEESEPAEDSAPADEEPADESESDEPADEDDPFFGEFGSITPTPGTPIRVQPGPAAAGASADPAGQLFFALGKWLGSRGGSSRGANPPFGAPDAVVQADFELGPADDAKATPATAEMAADDDPFAESGPADEVPVDDPFGEF